MEKIGVFCASSDKMDAVYTEEAKKLGEWIGNQNKTLIYGGSNVGLMEVVAQGVKQTGKGVVVGVVPKILIERGMVSECVGIKVPTEDLTDRKMWMMKLSDVFVVLPGSVGTLDEAFSVMSQNAIGISNKKVIFWNINGFWNKLFETFDWLSQSGAANKPFNDLMLKANSLEEVIELINKA